MENYNRRLAIPNEDGIIDKEIHCLLRQPFDVTCLDDTTVTVSTYNGIEVTIVPSHATRWKETRFGKWKDVSELKDPGDVTVGNISNAYVTSYTCNSVVVLESGGRQGRQLISSNDGLSGPPGLHFDISKNSLLVTKCHVPAPLYH